MIDRLKPLTCGKSAVPPRSPASFILPCLVELAGGVGGVPNGGIDVSSPYDPIQQTPSVAVPLT